MIDEHVM